MTERSRVVNYVTCLSYKLSSYRNESAIDLCPMWLLSSDPLRIIVITDTLDILELFTTFPIHIYLSFILGIIIESDVIVYAIEVVK